MTNSTPDDRRQLALEMAINSFAAGSIRPVSETIVARAEAFETYLANEEVLEIVEEVPEEDS